MEKSDWQLTFEQELQMMQMKSKVLCAKNLVKKDFFRLPDPFAKVVVDGSGQCHSTDTVKNTLDPKWNQHYDLYIGKSDSITISVWNHKKIHKKQGAGFLGCVRLLSNAINRLKDTGYQRLDLCKLGPNDNDTVRGQIVDPFDVARGRCTDEASYAEESTFTDHVEGDDWSDYSDHEEDTSYRLFNTSDYQPLARRVLHTLGLQTAPSTSSAPTLKGAKVLKSPAPTEHYIPVPDPIAKLASEEWAHPLKARRFKNTADRLYALAPDFATKLDVPGIDEPIARLVSRSILPREGESHLKDTTERRIDFALCKNHEATALSMRASASASIFSRASMMWLDDLLEDDNPDPVAFKRALLKLRKTAAFVADATLDATQLGARAMTTQIVARRTLWLRHWQADSAARLNLSKAPYSGSLLFGEEALKAVLVDPKDAHKPVLATVKNIDHRPFRRFPSFRSNQPFRGTRPGGRGRDFRPYDSNAFRGSWNRRPQGRDLRLAGQLRQKPSPTNPTPTTSWGNVGHPAGNGLPVSRSHHCHHKHRKVPDATNIRRRHASRQSTRDVYLHNPHCTLGSSSHSAPSVDSVAFSKRHCQLQPSQSSFEPRSAPLLPLVDQGSTPLQGHVVQRTPQNRRDHRRQPHRLGSPLQLPVCSGGLAQRRASSKHQLAGTKGCPLGSMSFSVSVPFASCAHSNRQHVCKITFEQTRGHQVSSSAGLSLPHLCLGRTTSTIPESRAPQRDFECDSRLAQQTTGLPGRMETSSCHFPSSPVSVRRPLSRPVCFQSQLPASQVLCPIPGLNSRSSGCSDNTVARRSIVRLSSHTIVSQNLEEGANRKGTAGSDSTILATPSVVLRSSGNVNDGPLDTSSNARPLIPGSSTAPGPYLAQSNSVAFQRRHLRSAGLSDAVIDIILASRRPSTTRIYQHTWVAFSKWCQSHHHDPSQANVHQVLQFLHSGFMMGLRPNTLRRHASTLSSILSVSSPGDHISSHPFIKRFLRGVALRSPAVVHRFPSWSLPKVLQALQRPPFEPIRTVSLRILSFKVLFLIAITSARRVSELGALSSARHLCVFHKDSVVLKTDPSFRPKVDSVFHCNQDIVLPSFCPNPTHPLEKA
ncbi:E3 ubiquitin-protein ligase SMURF2 isoform X1 [Rhineura floridana]|uniref:E3 ubiquitin-protein ligase SMURF2 isoform X1 n=1 Tax=Rhineura floridana TaxID=261503 RepID=UPI002AC8690F|nr:E3 ubiquitin-protein ligase SMURF2 isoform X1 [Rhineura floridana]